MSKLRNKLDRARQGYEANQYPGDLATDLGMDAHATIHRTLGYRVAMAAALLLAASAAWWVLIPNPTGPTDTPDPSIALKPVPGKTSDLQLTADPPSTHDLMNPQSLIGVRLTSIPQRPNFNNVPDRPRFAAPQRPRSLSVGLTPRRFPSVRLKNFKSPTPLHRSNRDEKLHDDLS